MVLGGYRWLLGELVVLWRSGGSGYQIFFFSPGGHCFEIHHGRFQGWLFLFSFKPLFWFLQMKLDGLTWSWMELVGESFILF